MSLATWKREFYPTAASSAKAKKDPIAHSLRKWIGLLPSNLEKHGVWQEDWEIMDNKSSFMVDDSSCALCSVYWDNECGDCPLAKVRGDIPCDSTMDHEENSPYFDWRQTGNSGSMIMWLLRAKAQ